jgi:hypothetical protein
MLPRRVRLGMRLSGRRAGLTAALWFGRASCILMLATWALNGWFVVAAGNERLTASLGGGVLVLEWRSLIDEEVAWGAQLRRYNGPPLWVSLPQWVWADDITGVQNSTQVCPLWVLLILAGGFTFLAAYARKAVDFARQLREQGRCVLCSYDLRGNTSGVCPECGRGVAEWTNAQRASSCGSRRPTRLGLCTQYSMGLALVLLTLVGVAAGPFNYARSLENRLGLALVGLLGPAGWLTHATFGRLPMLVSVGLAASLVLSINWLVVRTRFGRWGYSFHTTMLLLWWIAGFSQVMFLASTWPE